MGIVKKKETFRMFLTRLRKFASWDIEYNRYNQNDRPENHVVNLAADKLDYIFDELKNAQRKKPSNALDTLDALVRKLEAGD